MTSQEDHQADKTLSQEDQIKTLSYSKAQDNEEEKVPYRQPLEGDSIPETIKLRLTLDIETTSILEINVQEVAMNPLALLSKVRIG